jgi:hypothetical protein
MDAPYPGSGTGQACAWDHPFRALPPDGTPRIAGGDTLVIAAGSYRMGYDAPGADNCESDYPWDCYMPPIPSGPDPAHPTRVVGAGWDAGCFTRPALWGTERANMILNLTDASNVEIACLEITDHLGCVESHTGGLACERDTYPYGNWAADGLYAEDSANVHLRDLNIHGLATAGMRAGRLSNWTVENVRIAGNGWVGWDGDIDGNDSNSGTLTFRHWTVEWNGCGETYPGGQPTGCWGQTAGGYGDGVGTGATGGDWIIEDSAFLHNTSDGLDLLYHELGGRIVIDRVRAEGNAGNQVKITGQSAITNSVLVGNCAFFEGKSFTYNVDPCRALGNALEVVYAGGEHVSIVNSTFYGQGDGLVGGGPREGYSCNGTESLMGRNNIFLGDTDYFDPGDVTFLFYQEGCAGLKLDSDYNIAYNAKNIECGTNGPYVNSRSHDLCQNPQLSGPFTGNEYGMVPVPGSPAIDTGNNAVCPATDILGNPRPVDGNEDGNAICDRGAYEWWGPFAISVTKTATPTMVYAGDTVSFTIRVDNLSVEPVTLTRLDDTVFGDLTDECGLPVLIATDNFSTCVISRTIEADHTNTVTATAEDGDGDEVTDSDDASVDVIDTAVRVVKQASADTVKVGETITYTYIVENVGNTTLTNVSASDNRLGTISLGHATLAQGEVTTGTAAYLVIESDLPGPLTNTVTVTGTPPVGADVIDTDTITVFIKPKGSTIYLPIVLKR